MEGTDIIKIYNICNQMCVHCPNPSNVKNKVVEKTTDQDIRKQLLAAKGQGFEHNSNELLVYADSGSDEHEKQSYAYEKLKSDSCKNCSFDCCCAGLQKSYAKIYGLSELKPRKADLQNILNNVRKYHG